MYPSRACTSCRVRYRQTGTGGLCLSCYGAERAAQAAMNPWLCAECARVPWQIRGLCKTCAGWLSHQTEEPSTPIVFAPRVKAKAPQPVSAPVLYTAQYEGRAFDVVWNGTR